MTIPEAGRVKTIAKVEKRHPRHIQLIHTIPRDGARMRGGMLLRIGHKNPGLDMP